MADGIGRAKAYRLRAEELRRIADAMHPEARDQLRRLASNYDRMAANAELEAITETGFNPRFVP
jgi:hypothetical protein